MRAADVVAVVDALDAAGIWYRLDGGWGVDALVGRETRPHVDVDLVVQRRDVDRAAAALRPLGLAHDESVKPGLPARVVLRSADGRQVDLHPVVFDERGDGLQELGGGEWGRYSATGLEGSGRIAGRVVPCLTAELQLAHHAGYEQDDHDRHDVRILESVARG